MYLAINGIIPPKQWYHKAELQNNNGNTVAMLLAENKFIPPVEW